MNISRWMLALALALTSVTTLARQAPLENLAHRPFDSQNGREVAPGNLRIAVAEALLPYNGSITEERPGALVLRLAPRTHVANVRLDYDAKGFSITYLSSENLDYEKNRKGREFIHPNYNAWINRIADQVVTAPQLWFTADQLADYIPPVIEAMTGVDPDNQARIRFFGQAVLSLDFYRNSMCLGGARPEKASESGLGGVFGRKENITLGMPVTPNVVNLKARDGILAKAFYREYAINADEPLAIRASYAESTGAYSAGCRDFGASFVPEKDQDYEVTLDISRTTCRLVVTRISQIDGNVALTPVAVKAARKCE